MVKTAAFWLLFFIIVCSNMIGTGVIGHSRYIAVEAGVATGITALVVGLQSVCNGLGRLAFGTLFDKKGNTFAMLTDVGCFILSCCSSSLCAAAGPFRRWPACCSSASPMAACPL